MLAAAVCTSQSRSPRYTIGETPQAAASLFAESVLLGDLPDLMFTVPAARPASFRMRRPTLWASPELSDGGLHGRPRVMERLRTATYHTASIVKPDVCPGGMKRLVQPDLATIHSKDVKRKCLSSSVSDWVPLS